MIVTAGLPVGPQPHIPHHPQPPNQPCTQIHKVVEKADVVREGWNGFNVLHDAASRVAALDLGFLPSARARASTGASGWQEWVGWVGGRVGVIVVAGWVRGWSGPGLPTLPARARGSTG